MKAAHDIETIPGLSYMKVSWEACCFHLLPFFSETYKLIMFGCSVVSSLVVFLGWKTKIVFSKITCIDVRQSEVKKTKATSRILKILSEVAEQIPDPSHHCFPACGVFLLRWICHIPILDQHKYVLTLFKPLFSRNFDMYKLLRNGRLSPGE